MYKNAQAGSFFLYTIYLTVGHFCFVELLCRREEPGYPYHADDEAEEEEHDEYAEHPVGASTQTAAR